MFTIAIDSDTLAANDQLKTLPLTIGDMIIIKDADQNACLSADVHISSSKRANLFNNVVEVSRTNKAEQQATITNILNRYPSVFENFVKMDTTYIGTPHLGKFVIPVMPFDEGTGILLKPSEGARGLGIYKGKFSRKAVIEFFKILTDIIAEYNTYSNTLTEKSTNFDIILTERLGKIGFEPIGGRPNFDNELVSNLNSLDYVIEKCYTSKFCEYRAMLLPMTSETFISNSIHYKGRFPFSMTRFHLNDLGSDKEEVVRNLDLITRTRTVEKEIAEFLDLLPLHYGSVDLWIDVENEKWGIFEYQSQYGHAFIPEKLHLDYMQEFLRSAVRMVENRKVTIAKPQSED